MQRIYNHFVDNIKTVRDLGTLYLYLVYTLKLPNDLSDLLRAQWVYTISAFDKLIHELIRVGMLECFNNNRHKSSKFLSFPISLDTLNKIQTSSIPPPEYWLEQEIVEKHKILSFQHPDKITEALSLIWSEKHKWYYISTLMNLNENDLRVKLINIINRRNCIVHEADIDIQSGLKMEIEYAETKDMIDFIFKLGESIFNSVK